MLMANQHLQREGARQRDADPLPGQWSQERCRLGKEEAVATADSAANTGPDPESPHLSRHKEAPRALPLKLFFFLFLF